MFRLFIYIFWSFYQKALRRDKNELEAYFRVLGIYTIVIFCFLFFNGVPLAPFRESKGIDKLYGIFSIILIFSAMRFFVVPHEKIKNIEYTAEQKKMYNKILLFGGAVLFLSICFGFIWDVINGIKWLFHIVENFMMQIIK